MLINVHWFGCPVRVSVSCAVAVRVSVLVVFMRLVSKSLLRAATRLLCVTVLMAARDRGALVVCLVTAAPGSRLGLFGVVWWPRVARVSAIELLGKFF
jgi:hypothetical protein